MDFDWDYNLSAYYPAPVDSLPNCWARDFLKHRTMEMLSKFLLVARRKKIGTESRPLPSRPRLSQQASRTNSCHLASHATAPSPPGIYRSQSLRCSLTVGLQSRLISFAAAPGSEHPAETLTLVLMADKKLLQYFWHVERKPRPSRALLAELWKRKRQHHDDL